jgi:RNA polymerase sigma factor (TIGR02999 family)
VECFCRSRYPQIIVNEVTHILNAIDQGDPKAADRLLPLVYEELRRLAAQRLAHEKPGQTLQPTALVHEAYLRLVGAGGGSDESEVSSETERQKDAGPGQAQQWDGRGHFFAAAAEAMRRILVDSARRKKRGKHGGDRGRVDLDERDAPEPHSQRSGVSGPLVRDEEIVALDQALTQLAAEDPAAAQVVQLHFFAGLSIEQVADTLGISRATAYRQWSYARAWLRCAMGAEEDETPA